MISLWNSKSIHEFPGSQQTVEKQQSKNRRSRSLDRAMGKGQATTRCVVALPFFSSPVTVCLWWDEESFFPCLTDHVEIFGNGQADKPIAHIVLVSVVRAVALGLRSCCKQEAAVQCFFALEASFKHRGNTTCDALRLCSQMRL